MGLFELLVIAALVAVFFGVGKLPDVMGTVGRTVKAFKDGVENPDLDVFRDDPPED